MLYITSYCSGKESIIGAVEELVSRGFRNIELTGGTRYESYSEDGLLELLDRHGLKYIIHNYFPPQRDELVLNLASSDETIKAGTLRLVEEAVRLTQAFAQDLYSIHAGYAHDLIPVVGEDGLFMPRDLGQNSKEVFFETLGYISRDLLPAGFRLAVENAFPAYGNGRFSMLSDPGDIFEFLDFCRGHPNLGLLLDMGHLNVAAHYAGFDKQAFLEDLLADHPEKIFELHISSNNGAVDSHDPSVVDSFEVTFARRVLDLLGDIPVVMEWHQRPSPGVCAQYESIRDFLTR